MHECLRYQNPIIRNHLASQYVLGSQTARVRKRTERLMRQDGDLVKEIYYWQTQLQSLTNTATPIQPPEAVWQNIHSTLFEPKEKAQESFWQKLSAVFSWWQFATAAMVVLLGVQFMMKPATITEQIGADYVALLDSNDEGSDPDLLVSVYLSRGEKPSRLEFEWNDRSGRTPIAGTRLFAIDKDDGKVTDLGVIANDSEAMLLTKAQWGALKNSSELVIATGEDFSQQQLLRGPCIQIAKAT